MREVDTVLRRNVDDKPQNAALEATRIFLFISHDALCVIVELHDILDVAYILLNISRSRPKKHQEFEAENHVTGKS